MSYPLDAVPQGVSLSRVPLGPPIADLVHQAGEILAHRMLTLHNLTFYQTLMANARSAIERGTFEAAAQAFRARYRTDRAPEGPSTPEE